MVEKTISVSRGTRTTVRALLVAGACLVLLIPVGFAGVVGVFATAEGRGEMTRELPADLKRLELGAANFNVDVRVEDGLDRPRLDVHYVGLNPEKPRVDVHTEGKERATVDLDQPGSHGAFGTVLATADLRLPRDLAADLTLKLTSTFGRISLGSDVNEGYWSGNAGAPDWSSSDADGNNVATGQTFATARLGAITVSSETGNVNVHGVSAPNAYVSSKSGNVSVAGLFEVLSIKTADGNARFNAAVSHTMRAVSTNGNLAGDLGTWRPVAQPIGGVSLQTYSGDVSLKLPRATSVPGGTAGKGYAVTVPNGSERPRVNVDRAEGKDAVPVRAASTTGSVTIGYSKALKSANS